MPTHLIELSVPVPLSHRRQLEQRVLYAAPGIESYALVERDDLVTAVRLTTSGAADPGELARKVDHVVAHEVLPQRLIQPRPTWRSPHAAKDTDGVFAELVALGVVHEMGEGAIATGPPFTEVLNALDRRVRRIATEDFGATEYRYPTLVATSALHRGGYLSSFPQLVFSAGRLHTDLDVYRHFVEALADSREPSQLLQQLGTHSGYCLPPTMCFHTYHQLGGRELPEGCTVVTSRGKSFRFESHYSQALERLWDFTIRETVFVGDEASTTAHRERFLHAVCEFVDQLELPAHVEPADDPFFAADAVPRRVLAQRLQKLKYELRVPAEGGRDMSVASFNIHGTTFGGPFDIRLPSGDVAHTACVGVGLERLAYALFCHHGTDPDRWPAQVRSVLGMPEPARNAPAR